MLYMPLRQGSSRCFSLDPYKYHKFSLRRLVSACWRGTTLRIHRILRYPGRDLDHQLLNCWTLTQNVAMNCNTQIFWSKFSAQHHTQCSQWVLSLEFKLHPTSSNQKLMGSHGECQVPLYGLVYGDLVMQRKNVVQNMSKLDQIGSWTDGPWLVTERCWNRGWGSRQVVQQIPTGWDLGHSSCISNDKTESDIVQKCSKVTTDHKNQRFQQTVHDRQSQATHFATTSRSLEFLGRDAKNHSEWLWNFLGISGNPLFQDVTRQLTSTYPSPIHHCSQIVAADIPTWPPAPGSTAHLRTHLRTPGMVMTMWWQCDENGSREIWGYRCYMML